jgi:hypothetical protein
MLLLEVEETLTIPTEASLELDTLLVMAIMVHPSALVVTIHTVTHTDHHPLLFHRMDHHQCLDHLLRIPRRVVPDLLQVHLLQAHLLLVHHMVPIIHQDRHQDLHQDRHQDRHQDLHQVRHLVQHLES